VIIGGSSGTGVPEPQREALFTTLAERTLTKTIGEAEQIAATHLYLMENRTASSPNCAHR
jgi:hypothetical protein